MRAGYPFHGGSGAIRCMCSGDAWSGASTGRGVPSDSQRRLFFGQDLLGPDPAPRGTQVLACVDDCSVFETEIMDLSSDGDYDLLAIYPKDQSLRVRPDQLLPGKPVWSNQGS